MRPKLDLKQNSEVIVNFWLKLKKYLGYIFILYILCLFKLLNVTRRPVSSKSILDATVSQVTVVYLFLKKNLAEELGVWYFWNHDSCRLAKHDCCDFK